ncbi:MAG: F0F1 ATP synthase subunit B', partial [Pseudomonadota bacterium]
MATETTGAEEAATGLPQLDFSTFPNQIFWLIVTLVAIYLILNRVA